LAEEKGGNMERLSIKDYYLEILGLVAARSTCVRRAVGAIITDEHNQVLSTGYNGVPRHFDHCISNPCAGASDSHGDNSNCLAVHAEQNALLQCTDLDRARIMYVSCLPCFACSKMIANTNIRTVICKGDYADKRGLEILLQADCVIHIGEQIFGLE